MSKNMSKFKRIALGLLAISALVVLGRMVWLYQPWLAEGRTVQLTSGRIGDFDFQVWQRKEQTPSFATALFARKQDGKWRVFLLQLDDTYRPSVALRKENSRIAVIYRGQELGFFDETNQVFLRARNGLSFTGVEIDSDPPGRWWLRSEEEH